MFHELWRPPGQDQDTWDLMGKQSISFPDTFILWWFFKSKKEACWKLRSECGPCTMTMHSPSGWARVEVVLGSLAQKTIFHLKKSCCSCWFSHSLQLGGNATGLAQNSEEKRKPKLTGSRDINLWLQTQCWGTTHHTRVCMVHPKSDVHPSPDCREGQHTESRTLTLCLYFDSGLFWSSTSHMQHFILLSEASCGGLSARINSLVHCIIYASDLF